MNSEISRLTKAEIAALKSRWYDKDPAGKETILQRMVHQLKAECKKQNSKRPLQLDLRGITLLNEDLSGLDLSGYDFSYANLNRSNLTGSTVSYSTLHSASLEKATLDECEFIGSDLTHANLNECSAKQCGLGGANLSNASIINADLSEATLSRSILFHTDLRASKLENVRLSESDLSGAIFTRASLRNSDFKNSNVNKANFELADMQRCRLLGIKNYKKAKWIGTDIRDLDLRGAYLVKRYIGDENYLYEFQVTSRFHRAVYFIWWATSDCGRSLFRWSTFMVSLTLIFALIYTQVNIDYGDYETPFSPIYFSFVTLTTLGYGDVLPASLSAQIVVTLQAISGYMGLGGLLSILGNKMARRAE